MHLLGGPLDGATIVGPTVVRPPDLVEVSSARSVHRYLVRAGGGYAFVAPQAAAEVSAIRFEEWRDDHGTGDDACRAKAWGAWCAALDAG